MTNKKRIGLTVPERLYNDLKEEASYHGQTLNAMITQIIWAWIQQKTN